MEEWVKEILKKERELRKLPLEVKELNKNYYLYRSTTHWDKKEKKVKKDSEYIGRITPKGVIEKKIWLSPEGWQDQLFLIERSTRKR